MIHVHVHVRVCIHRMSDNTEPSNAHMYVLYMHYCITFNFSVTVLPSLSNTVLQYIVCYSFTSHCLLYTFGLFSVCCMITLVHVYAEGKASKAKSESRQ